MEQLVAMQNNQVVTTSLSIAENFKKRHDNVLRDIEILKEDVLNFEEMFKEGETLDSYNRTRKTYFMNRDGFTLLAMGFTGKEALQFKLKYIEAFNQMEKSLNQPKVLSEKEQLKASMKLSLETSEELEGVKNKVLNLEERFDNELTLSHGQATTLNHAVKKRVESLYEYGIMGTLETKRQMYSHIHSQLRRAFQAPTYREVKRVDFDEAIQWVGAWRPL